MTVKRVCFISILRLLQLLRAQTDPDFTYVAAELSYLTVVEVNGAIVCACVMTLKPLLSRFCPRFLSSGGSGTLARSGPSARGGHGGPPTIGSIPSRKGAINRKGTMSERDGWMEGGASGRMVWVEGGYVEIDERDVDVWGADVELVENATRKGAGVKAESNVNDLASLEYGWVRVDTEVRVQVFKAGE